MRRILLAIFAAFLGSIASLGLKASAASSCADLFREAVESAKGGVQSSSESKLESDISFARQIEAQRNHFRDSGSSQINTTEKSATNKLATITAGLMEFLGLEEIPKELLARKDSLINKLGITSTSPLSAVQVKEIVEALLPLMLPEGKPRGNFWVRRFITGERPSISSRFTDAVTQSKFMIDFISDLVDLGLAQEPGIIGRMRMRTSLLGDRIRQIQLFPLLRSLIVNGVSVYAGLSPIHIPKTRLIDWVPVGAPVEREIESNRGQRAYDLVVDRLSTWAKVDRGLRVVQRVWLTGLIVVGLSVLPSKWPYVESAFRMSILTPHELQQHEQRTYDSQNEVRKQFNSWLKSLDYEPSAREKEEMLSDLREQESNGTLKIFGDERAQK